MKRTWARRAAVGVAVLAAGRGLWQGIDGWPTLATHLRDDAFYEFAWACNLADGLGPTVSQGVGTSGVQYLWCLLLSLLGGGDRALLPQLAVGLGVACHLLGALSWLVAGRGAAALCIACLWLGNPLLIRECQNGQETALACLLLALLWQWRSARAVFFAPLAIAVTLARSDLWLVVLPLSLLRHGRCWWRGLPLAGAAALAHVALNLWSGGHWLQDSALPMPWLVHANFAATAPAFGEWVARAWFYARPVLLGGPFETISAPALAVAAFVLARPLVPPSRRWLPLLLVLAGIAAGAANVLTPLLGAVLLLLLPARARVRPPLALAALAIGLGALLVLHWAVRWYPRDYYAAPLAVLAAAGLQHVRHRYWLLLGTAAGTLLLPGLPREPLSGQREMELAGRFLHQFVPRGEAVGSFNSGIIAWYASMAEPGHVVRNLDGVVDRGALRALQAARLQDWLDDLGVRFLADNPVQFALDPRRPHAAGRWFGGGFDPAVDLVELARFRVSGVDDGAPGGDALRLYWRRGRGQEPDVEPGPARQLGRLGDGTRALLWPAAGGERLLLERSPGILEPLVESAAPAVWVIGVPPGRIGTGRVFAAGQPVPLLVLD